ncbi:MAG: transcriptional repressor [Corticimicrobacter sp.]|uniref:transcriptional repressor n=1 Tax=Corticimicrobacter sp. TaxID=2678536 RepID=UPI0032DB9E0D
MSTDRIELKDIGLKVTFPRLKILDVFRSSEQRHLSAEDVYRLLMNDGVEIGLATVYRVLTQFEQVDLLKRSQLGSSKAVYELNDGERNHGHIVCTQSGDVTEFYDPQIEKRLQKICEERGFTLSEHTITVFATPKA